MYYWHILQRDDNELVFKFFTAQKLSPSVHDWVLQIKKDESNLDICLTYEEIKEIKKDKFKKLVEQQVEKFAMNYLENIRKSHSKTEFLKITKFSPQEYLASKNLIISETQNLFKLRNFMINVKENFKTNFTQNRWCRICFLFKETQQHLVDCPPIRKRLNGLVKFENLKYNMIFGTLKNQEIFAKNYTLILSARDDLITPDSEN